MKDYRGRIRPTFRAESEAMKLINPSRRAVFSSPTFRAESEAMKLLSELNRIIPFSPTFRAESEAMKRKLVKCVGGCAVRRLEPNQRR